MQEFKYLGYKAHIRDRMRKAGIVMKGVWRIGNRKFGKNWSPRM